MSTCHTILFSQKVFRWPANTWELKGNSYAFLFEPFHLVLRQTYNPHSMEKQKKNTGLYWILFLISTAAFIFAIGAHFEYLTLILPFVCTFFVKAMDIM